MPTHLRFRPGLLTEPLLVFFGATGCGNSSFAGEPASTSEFADAGTGDLVSVQAFVGARILDGTGVPLLENGVVVVRDGLMAEVETADALSPPPGAEILDLEGRFLLPGFVNAQAVWAPTGIGPTWGSSSRSTPTKESPPS